MSAPPSRPAPRTGPARVYRALFYSLSGFRHAWRDEAAFREELVLAAALSLLCLYLPLDPGLTLLILCSHVLVLVAELLNTAVEAVVDMVSPDYHPGAEKAKDTGSCAVFLCMLMSGGLWGYALWTLLR